MKQRTLQKWDPLKPAFWETPFGLMRRLTGDIERLFEEFPTGRLFSREPRFLTEPHWFPNVDVFEKDGNLTIRADLPGMAKEDVDIEVTDEAITIQGERKKEFEEEREGMYRMERAYGRFYRAFPLPKGVKPADVKATFKNGVLEVFFPMPAEEKTPKGRRVEIQGGIAAEKTTKTAA